MKHHILVKWNPSVTDKAAMLAQVSQLYAGATAISGVAEAAVYGNVTDRPNRYDLMIVLTMPSEALPAWDASDLHKRRKAEYGALIAQKAIFDCD